MKKDLFSQLFIFEMANNHSGDVAHGLNIIRAFKEVSQEFHFNFAFKFQYRDLDTFIHPDYKARKDIKYVKRFLDTRLSDDDFLRMLEEVKRQGFLSICTAFDEKSVDKVLRHGYDFIKIASCSFTDWPLIEKIAQTQLPIIASTAAAALEEVDKVVSFFEHRNKTLCLMHCVGAYPTLKDALQLNQIDLLAKRYPEVAIGFSTHEEPDNLEAIAIAIAKGASVFERHVNVPTSQYGMNAYSSTPQQIRDWLLSAQEAYRLCGARDGVRYAISSQERNDLRGLRRGVFALRPIKAGEKINSSNVFYAIPNIESQLLANDMSKYTEYISQRDFKQNAPIMADAVKSNHLREKVLEIVKQLKDIIVKSNIRLPNRMELELSHHYGIERYAEYGAAILNFINREYCKKLIILLPGQKHPVHHHIKKEETFHVLYGDMVVNLQGKEMDLTAGDMVTVERNEKHGFSSKNGCVFEEVSTTHYEHDSFYEDDTVTNQVKRKTEVTYWSDWLEKEVI